jgi:hypothetical protein
MNYTDRYAALAGRRTGCALFHTQGVAIGLGYAGLSALGLTALNRENAPGAG